MLATKNPAKRLRALVAAVLAAMLLLGCVQSESPSDEHLAANETENDNSDAEGDAGNGETDTGGDGTGGDSTGEGGNTDEGDPGEDNPGDGDDPGDGGDPEKMICPRPA